ncbi:hypothetical protein MAN_10533, partial [Metarhizium hybridum]
MTKINSITVKTSGHKEAMIRGNRKQLSETSSSCDQSTRYVEEIEFFRDRITAVRDKQLDLERLAGELRSERNLLKCECSKLQEQLAVTEAGYDTTREEPHKNYMDCKHGMVAIDRVAYFQLTIDKLMHVTRRGIPENAANRVNNAGKLVLSAVHDILGDCRYYASRPDALSIKAVRLELGIYSQKLLDACKSFAVTVASIASGVERLDALILLSNAADQLTHGVMSLLKIVKIHGNVHNEPGDSQVHTGESDKLHIKISGQGELDEFNGTGDEELPTRQPLRDMVRQAIGPPSPSSDCD